MFSEEELEKKLRHVAERESRFGWRNYAAAYFVAVLALIGSISASFLAAFNASRWLTAVVAIVPAAVLSLTKIFSFERRAIYHWKKSKQYRGLLRRLRHEGAEIAVVSKELRNDKLWA